MKNKLFINLSLATLQRATEIQQVIEDKRAELQALLTGESVITSRNGVSKRSRGTRFDEAHKAKLSAALKAAWAKRKAAKAAPAPEPEPEVKARTKKATPRTKKAPVAAEIATPTITPPDIKASAMAKA